MNDRPESDGGVSQYRRGRTRWRVRDEWRDVLLGPEGFRLGQWLGQGQARVVKHGANRTVYRVELPGRIAFFVKHYQPRSWRDAARALARGSLARYEWGKTCEAARRGLPTALPLAWGEELRAGMAGDSYFVTQAVDDVLPLQELLESLSSRPPAEAARLRRHLVDQLAALCADCHRAGVRQSDFHTHNILVQISARGRGDLSGGWNDHDPLRLFLIDLPSVRFSQPLGWTHTRRHLGIVSAGLSRHGTIRERWRFWRRYLQRRPDLGVSDPRDAAKQIERCARGSAQRVARRRDRRCWRNNRDYQRLDTPHGRIYGAADMPRERLAALAADPEGPLRAFRHRAVKLSHVSVVVEALWPTAAGVVRLAYKRSRGKCWWKAPLGWLRRPRALVGWRLAHALTIRGIATARALAAFRPAHDGEGYLATEWLAGAENLHLYGWRLAGLSAAERFVRARRCVERLGELIGRMHAWEVSHRDLKAGNLAVVDRRRGAEAETYLAVYLLDLDGVRLRRRLSRSARVRNLARMAVSLRMHPWISRTLLLRFLLAYARAYGLARGEWKPLWRDAARACRRMIAHRQRRGRMVA